MNIILQKLGLKDGESIDHPWINKALERAQQKVEARNFDIRKSLLKFDNVLTLLPAHYSWLHMPCATQTSCKKKLPIHISRPPRGLLKLAQ